MTTIQTLEEEVKKHSKDIGILVEEPEKVAAMIASKWELMSKLRMSATISLSLLPLMESMGLLESDRGNTAIEFRDYDEQIGVVRTLKWMSGKACKYHQDLRRDGYYKSERQQTAEHCLI